jgi:hypothetical protein
MCSRLVFSVCVVLFSDVLLAFCFSFGCVWIPCRLHFSFSHLHLDSLIDSLGFFWFSFGLLFWFLVGFAVLRQRASSQPITVDKQVIALVVVCSGGGWL